MLSISICGGNSFVSRGLGIDSQAENCQATCFRGVFRQQANPTRVLCKKDIPTRFILLFGSIMESRPTPNILHDHPINNVVKKDWIHVEALKKEWRSVEQLAKAEPRYHINPYKK